MDDSSVPGFGCLSAAVAALLVCSCDAQKPFVVEYVPQVVFTGFFNGEYDSLDVNSTWPNRCELVGDTVRILCHSTLFSETNSVRHGNLLRLDLYPDSGDGFEKRNVMFHLARYYDTNESYTVNKKDTVDNTIQFASEIVSFGRTGGARIELDEIYVSAPPLVKGKRLEIVDGRLFGSVHLP